jgi:hypothetical protein
MGDSPATSGVGDPAGGKGTGACAAAAAAAGRRRPSRDDHVAGVGKRRCCIWTIRGRVRLGPLSWIRSPRRGRRTRRSAAGRPAPRPPAHRGLPGRSPRTHGRHDDPGATVLLASSHRTQPCLQAAVIGLDAVVGGPLGAVPGRRQQVLQHDRVGCRSVGPDRHWHHLGGVGGRRPRRAQPGVLRRRGRTARSGGPSGRPARSPRAGSSSPRRLTARSVRDEAAKCSSLQSDCSRACSLTDATVPPDPLPPKPPFVATISPSG